MSVTGTAATSTQNLSSMILQQLLSGSNAQATSGLPASVLQEVLSSTGATPQSAAATPQVPAAITQALGDLLSGNDPSGSAADLSQLQSYFKQNPGSLTSVLNSLQGGAGTYSANGTVSSASSSLLSALGLSASGSSSSSSSTSSSSLISELLAGQSQDPLLASLGSSSSGLSMLG